MPVSRIARRIVGELRQRIFKPNQNKRLWDRTLYQKEEFNTKKPWLPPGWPYAGWFNFNPSHNPGVLPVRIPKPDAVLKKQKRERSFTVSKRNAGVVRTIDQLSLEALRTMIFNTRGPIYNEYMEKPTAEELEAGFVARLQDTSKPFEWSKYEKMDLLARRKYRAEAAGVKFDESAEKAKLDEPVENSAENRAMLKDYAKALEGYGWKDPYQMTDAEVEEEAEALRALFIVVPNQPFHGPQHEWTQRQDLVVEEWQEKGIPCFAGDPFRPERQPQPLWTKGYEYIGGHNDFEEELAGPPGSYLSEKDDEDLPPGTNPDAPKPVPKYFRDKSDTHS